MHCCANHTLLKPTPKQNCRAKGRNSTAALCATGTREITNSTPLYHTSTSVGHQHAHLSCPKIPQKPDFFRQQEQQSPAHNKDANRFELSLPHVLYGDYGLRVHLRACKREERQNIPRSTVSAAARNGRPYLIATISFPCRFKTLVLAEHVSPALSALSSGRSSDPMNVLRGLVRRVILNDPVHRGDVEPTCRDVGAQQHSGVLTK